MSLGEHYASSDKIPAECAHGGAGVSLRGAADEAPNSRSALGFSILILLLRLLPMIY